MHDDSQPPGVRDLARTADRLDALADTAELMGDDAGSRRFRERAASCRERAMTMLDACK